MRLKTAVLGRLECLVAIGEHKKRLLGRNPGSPSGNGFIIVKPTNLSVILLLDHHLLILTLTIFIMTTDIPINIGIGAVGISNVYTYQALYHV
jgi:hypothetical protein